MSYFDLLNNDLLYCILLELTYQNVYNLHAVNIIDINNIDFKELYYQFKFPIQNECFFDVSYSNIISFRNVKDVIHLNNIQKGPSCSFKEHEGNNQSYYMMLCKILFDFKNLYQLFYDNDIKYMRYLGTLNEIYKYDIKLYELIITDTHFKTVTMLCFDKSVEVRIYHTKLIRLILSGVDKHNHLLMLIYYGHFLSNIKELTKYFLLKEKLEHVSAQTYGKISLLSRKYYNKSAFTKYMNYLIDNHPELLPLDNYNRMLVVHLKNKDVEIFKKIIDVNNHNIINSNNFDQNFIDNITRYIKSMISPPKYVITMIVYYYEVCKEIIDEDIRNRYTSVLTKLLN